MTIEIPDRLHWVAYLVGSEWPDGDEDALFRNGRRCADAAAMLAGLIPDLQRVHARLLAVLGGQAALAFDAQFHMLFTGDYAVGGLAGALSALGKLFDQSGTALENGKLSILFSVGKAAAEILYAYFTASETWGASLKTIPITEAFTRYSVRQAVLNLLKQVFGQLDQALKKTLVKELLREGIEDVEWAVLKESTVQGIQIANGHRASFDLSKAEKSVGVAFIGGAVNHGAKDWLKDIVKSTRQRVVTTAGTVAFREIDDPVEGAITGALTGYAGGVAGNTAGTLASGGTLEPATLFTSGITSAIKGGASGAAKAHSQVRYDRDAYPTDKTASAPFTKPSGWSEPLPARSLAAAGAAAGAAAWVPGHPSSSHATSGSQPTEGTHPGPGPAAGPPAHHAPLVNPASATTPHGLSGWVTGTSHP